MLNKKVMKSAKALLLCGIIATSSIAFAGCNAKASKKTTKSNYTQFTMDCCGTANLYGYKSTIKSCGAKKLSLSSCSYFTCTSSTGRYSIFSNGTGIRVWTVDSKNRVTNDRYGTIDSNGKKITIVV